MNKLIMMIGATAVAVGAYASSITVDSVAQRWPWNNKVDITYTVTDGQDVANGLYNYIVFTMSTNGAVCATIDGRHDVGANASNGTHTVTWTPPSGIKCDNCTMSATLYATEDGPSGDDYMIVDLTTGEVTYEGLLASQDASNARYNTDTGSGTTATNPYKETKLVLRKVPRGGTYPTGDDDNFSSVNSRRTWTTDRDFYVGIYPVTQLQYQNITGGNTSPSGQTSQSTSGDSKTDRIAHRPVSYMTYSALRGTSVPGDTVSYADSASTAFFEKLNYMTNLRRSLTGFDLPTEVMSEIAARAGSTTAYWWGDAWDDTKGVFRTHSGGKTVAVGSKAANAWGLYDVTGNLWEFCRDGNTLENMADATSAFTPAPAQSDSDNNRIVRGGVTFSTTINDSAKNNSMVSYRPKTYDAKSYYAGFRVAIVMP